MIRNPMEWLRAAHEQSIKGGRFESYSLFFKKEKSYLKNSLDDLQFHFTRKPYFDEDEYTQLLDCMTDGGKDMLIYHA